jgi:D-alanyl-D-alanine carboxypeptidase/D-alanyl-D-alanine-endopeptidase (penicillin-binding protein 4)
MKHRDHVDRVIRTLIFSVVTAVCVFPVVAAGLPQSVQKELARAGVPASAVSVVVEPVLDGPVLVSHEAKAPVNPASVMKLVTTYAALDLLGPAFTFRTDFLLDGALARGVLDGNLVIRGGGDPKLTYDNLWRIAHQLRARGLREIRGDVVVDRGYFAPVAHDPGRFDNEPRRAYNVGIDALLVNFQAVNFTVAPDAAGVRVSAEPDFPNVQVVSRIALVQESCGDWRRNIKVDFEETGLIATVAFSGTFSQECGEKSWALRLFDGPRYTEAAWRWVWSEAGGVLRGKVRAGPTPVGATLLHRHESEPLANLVRDTNKFSNNVMARHVFLALSAERSGAPGEARASERIVREWLRTRAIDAPELSIENGSGLSRTDRVSAATVAAVLRSAWASPLMPELTASLPVFAVDGTLKTRRGGAVGQAHLKGGTLTGVQSVAGYVLDARGRRWIVVMIVNHPGANAAQPAIDALVEWVYRLPGKRGAP